MSKISKAQSTETINNKDDGSINFRPSPNFKHMKKYLKSKFEEDMNLSIEKERKLEAKDKVNMNLSIEKERKLEAKDKVNMNLSIEKERKLEAKDKVNLVQPPLPPNSPPPDSPLGFVLKQEVQDDEYEQHSEETVQELPQIQSTPQEPERKKPVMCKDFVRKTCTRGSACIYAHEIDYSQLKGVYKFCRDFENGCCNRPVCYFVHATTWEKEYFFRSAYLPPRALAHLKTPITQAATDGQKEMPPIFTNPPPVPPPSVASAPLDAPLGGGAPAPHAPHALPAHHAPHAPNAPPAPATPLQPALKHEWRDLYDFASPPHDLHAKETLAKKCKRCELTELRLQHSKAQVAQALRSSREMDAKLESVLNKNNRLSGVLKVLLKPRQRVLEHMSNSFLAPSRLPAPLDDAGAGEEALLAQMKVLLTKILLGGEGSPEGAAPGS